MLLFHIQEQNVYISQKLSVCLSSKPHKMTGPCFNCANVGANWKSHVTATWEEN